MAVLCGNCCLPVTLKNLSPEETEIVRSLLSIVPKSPTSWKSFKTTTSSMPEPTPSSSSATSTELASEEPSVGRLIGPESTVSPYMGLLDGVGLTDSSGLLDGVGLTDSSGLLDGVKLTDSSGLLDGVGLTDSSGLLDGVGITDSPGLLDGAGLTDFL